MSDLLTVRNLAVDFALEGGSVQAVRGASFRVPYGKTVALVGESGSGKSVCAQAIMGLLPKAARIKSGEILFDRAAGGGNDWNQKGGIVDIAQLTRDGPEMRAIRGAAISIIFQEPMTSLSPVHTVGHQITEAQRFWLTCQPDAAAFTFAAGDITKLGKAMHHLHQMVSGDAVMLGYFTHAVQSIRLCGQIHQASQAVISKLGELHNRLVNI